MASVEIKWNDGAGNIVASFTGSGDGSVVLQSDASNEGLDREQSVHVATSGGEVEVDVTVRQTGLREEFLAADGGFRTADGEIYGVLKP